jgi:hypothetical protein
MSKYANLGRYLEQQSASLVRMTFREVEAVIGCPLPRSARYPAWWSNNPSNNVMTKVWLEAGFKTEQVDIEGRKLVFRRVKPAQVPFQGFSEERSAVATSGTPAHTGGASSFHPAYGSMKGLMQVAPGVDLTKPADPEWGKVYE